MDDYKELDELLGYSPEKEYTSVDDEMSNTEILPEPDSAPAAEGAPASDDDGIPYYTPAQFEPTPVSEHTVEPELAEEDPRLMPALEEPQAASPAPIDRKAQAMNTQPVRQNQPYRRPVPPQPQYQGPAGQQARPAQQPPRQPQPYQRSAPYQQPMRQPAPYRQPQPQYQRPAQYQQPTQYRQPEQYQQPMPYRQQTPYRRPEQYRQPQYRQPEPPTRVDINYNPYESPPQPQPEYPAAYQKPEKPKTSAGTKAFIAILAGLLVVMLIAFGVFIAMNAKPRPDNPNIPPTVVPDSTQAIEDDNPFYFGNNAIGATEFEEEIELIADNGETQQRKDDIPESVGTPDKNAKQIELKGLPSDKTDAKYTTQYAFDTVSPGVVYVAVYQDKISEDNSTLVSQGTGTVITSDGYIITNAHVIGNSRRYLVQVTLSSEKSYPAKIVGFDNWTDIAVLKIDAKDLTPVTFGDSELIEIGQDVIAIGNAGGTFKNSLTKGVVSAVNRELTINKNVKYIQSDAAINPGNSGGPLCNLYGQVIGITSIKISSNVYESMSFSIPSKTVQEIASDLMRYGYVKDRVRMGFSGMEITQEDMYYYGLPAGICIESISEDSPLKDTDIQQGDIITAVDGIDITSFQDVYDILSDHKPGDKITLKIYRQK